MLGGRGHNASRSPSQQGPLQSACAAQSRTPGEGALGGVAWESWASRGAERALPLACGRGKGGALLPGYRSPRRGNGAGGALRRSTMVSGRLASPPTAGLRRCLRAPRLDFLPCSLHPCCCWVVNSLHGGAGAWSPPCCTGGVAWACSAGPSGTAGLIPGGCTQKKSLPGL